MFPDGEISAGRNSVLRGGRIKRGVCLLAARSGCPVLPCVIVGTEKLLALEPWLPAWRGRLWEICGDFIPPVTGPDRRAARAEKAGLLVRAARRRTSRRHRWPCGGRGCAGDSRGGIGRSEVLASAKLAVAFGEPLVFARTLDRKSARATLVSELQAGLRQLAIEVRSHGEN